MSDILDKAVSDYLRDAQFRIGEITIQMDEQGYDLALHQIRVQLYNLTTILWIERWDIKDGYNHLTAGGWTEDEILTEIDRLRDIGGLVEVPFYQFVGQQPQFVTVVLDEQATAQVALPTGNPGDFIYYNLVGIGVTVPFFDTGGMVDGEAINTFFSGRL